MFEVTTLYIVLFVSSNRLDIIECEHEIDILEKNLSSIKDFKNKPRLSNYYSNYTRGVYDTIPSLASQ